MFALAGSRVDAVLGDLYSKSDVGSSQELI